MRLLACFLTPVVLASQAALGAAAPISSPGSTDGRLAADNVNAHVNTNVKLHELLADPRAWATVLLGTAGMTAGLANILNHATATSKTSEQRRGRRWRQQSFALSQRYPLDLRNLDVQWAELSPQERFVRRENLIWEADVLRDNRITPAYEAFFTCRESLGWRVGVNLRVHERLSKQCWDKVRRMLRFRRLRLSPAAQAELDALHAEFRQAFPGQEFPREIALLPPPPPPPLTTNEEAGPSSSASSSNNPAASDQSNGENGDVTHDRSNFGLLSQQSPAQAAQEFGRSLGLPNFLPGSRSRAGIRGPTRLTLPAGRGH